MFCELSAQGTPGDKLHFSNTPTDRNVLIRYIDDLQNPIYFYCTKCFVSGQPIH